MVSKPPPPERRTHKRVAVVGSGPAGRAAAQQNRRVAGSPVEGKGITARGKKVVILGGGDTSADCLRNAHREGATSLRVIAHGPKPPESPDPLE